MPQIHVVYDPDEEPVLTGEPVASLGDLLIMPVGPPEPEPELTPEQVRSQEFHGSAGAFRERLSQGEWNQPGRGRIKNATEVCELAGWPRRHISIGRNCPHGLLNEETEVTDGRVG